MSEAHVELPASWELNPRLRRRFGGTTEKQRALLEAESGLLVLHACPEQRQGARTALIIHRAPDGTLQTFPDNRGEAAVRTLLQTYRSALDELEAPFRNATRARELQPVLRRLNPLLRALRSAHQVLQAACEQFREDGVLTRLRDGALALEREAELLLGDARTELEIMQLEEAEAQAEANEDLVHSSQRLNIMVALLLPLTAIASVFGMNLSSGIESAPVWLFWAVLVVSVLLGAFMLGWVRRRRP